MSTAKRVLTALLIPALTVAAACHQGSGGRPAGSGAPFQADDRGRFFGEPVVAENLTVWPVHGRAAPGVGEYRTLAGAYQAGTARVLEKGTESGGRAAVNELRVENRGERPILVCAGTLLRGGKQDRQVGRDLVIEPGAILAMDAFCVERNRWSMQREGRSTGGVFEVYDLVAAKRIRTSAQYAASQGQVWEQTGHVNRVAGRNTRTGTFLATVDEDRDDAVVVRRRLEGTVRGGFEKRSPQDPIVGFAYAINGEPISMRTFATGDLFQSHFPAFLRTMCLEAQVVQFRDQAAGRVAFTGAADLEALLTMVRGINEAPARVIPDAAVDPGASKIGVRRNGFGGNSACLVRRNGKAGWFTLTEDWTAPAEFQGEARLEMLEQLTELGYTSGD